MYRLIVPALLLALAPATTGAAEKAAWRALVADHVNGKLTLLDMASGEAIGHYGVAGPARLKLSPDGRYAVVAQGSQNRAGVVDLGITLTSHGDHADVEVSAPRFGKGELTGEKPSHVNFGSNGTVAVFFDGEGAARLTDLPGLVAGKAKLTALKTAFPQHGLAAPVGEFVALSIPHPTERKELPVGIELVRRNGTSLVKADTCPRLHGEAKSGPVSVYGCADGVLMLTVGKGTGTFAKIPYPAHLPAERMVRNFAGAESLGSFLGDFGPDGMVVLDARARSFEFVKLPARRMHFARDPVEAENGWVMIEDGRLLKVNALTGKIAGEVAVTAAYSMEGGSAVARPRLSASGGKVVVTDPAASKVHVIDGGSMRILRSIPVPGAPFDVVATGAAGGEH